MPRKGSSFSKVLSALLAFLWPGKAKKKPRKRRKQPYYGNSPLQKVFKDFQKNVTIHEFGHYLSHFTNYTIMNPVYSSTGPKPGLDSAAELFLQNGELSLPLMDDSYKMCPIVRWYDPDCVPAIVSEIIFDREISIKIQRDDNSVDIKSNVLTVLFGVGQYILLPSGTPVPGELLEEIKQHFQSRGISRITDGKHKPFWSGVDLGNGQDYSAITVASGESNGRGLGTSGRSGKNNPHDLDWIISNLNIPSEFFDGYESNFAGFNFSSQESWLFQSREQITKHSSQ